jgi:hypothetical protein
VNENTGSLLYVAAAEGVNARTHDQPRPYPRHYQQKETALLYRQRRFSIA